MLWAGVHGDTDGLRPVVERLATFSGTPWTADTVALVHSRLGAGTGGTARYETIGSWGLTRRAPRAAG